MPGKRPSVKHRKHIWRTTTYFLPEGKFKHIHTRKTDGARFQATDTDPMIAFERAFKKAAATPLKPKKKTRAKPKARK